MTWIRLTRLSSLLVCFGSCDGVRPDDGLEPNDTAAQATRLQIGSAIEARANQGNPDVFVFDVAASQAIVIELQSRGLENCPGFTLVGPGEEVLFADRTARCRRVGPPATQKASVDFEIFADGSYRFRSVAEMAGPHYLTVLEGGDADNVFSYSWDYRITASAVSRYD